MINPSEAFGSSTVDAAYKNLNACGEPCLTPFPTYSMESEDSKGSQHNVSVKDVALEEKTAAVPSTGIDPVAEKKLLRKLDFTLLPLFGLICKELPLRYALMQADSG
jgi:hypothetical protein